MTKRDEAYLRFINALSRKLYYTIADCNARIAEVEMQANAEIDRLRLAQVEADQRKIDTVLGTADEIWQELQAAEANVARLQGKLKVKKRMLRQE